MSATGATGAPRAASRTSVGSHLTGLGTLAGLFRREMQRLLADEPWAVELGARPPMYGTLMVIAAREPVSQREVSDTVLLHPSDMVSLMDHLEAHDLVRRVRDPRDRRRYQLTLTPAGRRTLERYDDVALRAERTVLAPLTASERATLARITAKAVAGVKLP